MISKSGDCIYSDEDDIEPIQNSEPFVYRDSNLQAVVWNAQSSRPQISNIVGKNKQPLTVVNSSSKDSETKFVENSKMLNDSHETITILSESGDNKSPTMPSDHENITAARNKGNEKERKVNTAEPSRILDHGQTFPRSPQTSHSNSLRVTEKLSPMQEQLNFDSYHRPSSNRSSNFEIVNPFPEIIDASKSGIGIRRNASTESSPGFSKPISSEIDSIGTINSPTSSSLCLPQVPANPFGVESIHQTVEPKASPSRVIDPSTPVNPFTPNDGRSSSQELSPVVTSVAVLPSPPPPPHPKLISPSTALHEPIEIIPTKPMQRCESNQDMRKSVTFSAEIVRSEAFLASNPNDIGSDQQEQPAPTKSRYSEISSSSLGSGVIKYSTSSYYEGQYVEVVSALGETERLKHGDGVFVVGSKFQFGTWHYGQMIEERTQSEFENGGRTISESVSKRSTVKDSMGKDFNYSIYGPPSSLHEKLSTVGKDDAENSVFGSGVIFYTRNSYYEGEYIEYRGEKLRHGRGILYEDSKQTPGIWDYGTFIDELVEESPEERDDRRSTIRESIINTKRNMRSSDQYNCELSNLSAEVASLYFAEKSIPGEGVIFYPDKSFYEGEYLIIDGDEKLRHGKGVLHTGSKSVEGIWDYGALIDEIIQRETESEKYMRRSMSYKSRASIISLPVEPVASNTPLGSAQDILQLYELDDVGVSGSGVIFYSKDSYYEGEWIILGPSSGGEKLRHGMGTLFTSGLRKQKAVTGRWDYGTYMDGSLVDETEPERDLRRSFVRRRLSEEGYSPPPSEMGGIIDRDDITASTSDFNSDTSEFRKDVFTVRSTDCTAENEIASPVKGIPSSMMGNGILFYSSDSWYDGDWLVIAEGNQILRHGNGTLYKGSKKLIGLWDYGSFVDESLDKETKEERELRRHGARESTFVVRNSTVPSARSDKFNHNFEISEKHTGSITRKSEASSSYVGEVYETDAKEKSLSVRVIKYAEEGESNVMDPFRFEIEILCGGVKYSVERHIDDFALFDQKIRKIFTRAQGKIPRLPLFSLSKTSQILQDDRHAYSEVVEKYGDVVKSRIAALNTYIAAIMTFPEIVISADFMFFLDPEVVSMNSDPIMLESSIHSVIFRNDSWGLSEFNKSLKLSFSVPRNHYLIWAFQTKLDNIQFGVEVKGKVQIPYLKYDSHEKTVLGQIEIRDENACTLCWSNTHLNSFFVFSKTDEMRWMTKIVDPQTYFKATKVKAAFAEQRKKLRLAANTLAHQIN